MLAVQGYIYLPMQYPSDGTQSTYQVGRNYTGVCNIARFASYPVIRANATISAFNPRLVSNGELTMHADVDITWLTWPWHAHCGSHTSCSLQHPCHHFAHLNHKGHYAILAHPEVP